MANFMAGPSRTSQFNKVHKTLKKHYKPVVPDPERPVLEHLLMACCLENAHYPVAEESLAALVHTFFDWNEIRVSTIRELAEVMAALPDPPAAASRVKRVLQHVFEASYSFDLEDLRKSNLGPAVDRLNKLDGTTPFSVAYVVQSALRGHAIPVDPATLAVLRLLELVTDEDVEACTVPGLERAIPKSKGIEFGSQLHQLGADFTANRYSPTVREILLQISPDVKDRLPRRRTGKKARSAKGEAEAAAQPADAQPGSEQPAPSAQPAPGDKKKRARKKSGGRKKRAGAESADAAAADKGPKAEDAASPPGKKPAAEKKRSASAKRKADSGKSRGPDHGSAEARSGPSLSKRKPR